MKPPEKIKISDRLFALKLPMRFAICLKEKWMEDDRFQSLNRDLEKDLYPSVMEALKTFQNNSNEIKLDLMQFLEHWEEEKNSDSKVVNLA